MSDFTINVQLDLEKDARNYRAAFNKNTHSSKRKEQVASITAIDLEKLRWMDENDVYPFLREYLEDFWDTHKIQAEEKILTIKTAVDKYNPTIFQRMASLTKHPIYRNDFTIFLTSFNRWPYNYQHGYTWSCIEWTWVLKAFIHELLHFQTISYYKPYIIGKLHDEKKFEELKESLTFLLNHDFLDIIEGPDNGYPQHQGLRKKLEEYRVHSDKDFDKLVEYWCDLVINE